MSRDRQNTFLISHQTNSKNMSCADSIRPKEGRNARLLSRLQKFKRSNQMVFILYTSHGRVYWLPWGSCNSFHPRCQQWLLAGTLNQPSRLRIDCQPLVCTDLYSSRKDVSAVFLHCDSQCDEIALTSTHRLYWFVRVPSETENVLKPSNVQWTLNCA